MTDRVGRLDLSIDCDYVLGGSVDERGSIMPVCELRLSVTATGDARVGIVDNERRTCCVAVWRSPCLGCARTRALTGSSTPVGLATMVGRHNDHRVLCARHCLGRVPVYTQRWRTV